MTEKKEYYERVSPVAESFRILRTNLKQMLEKNEWKTIAVTAAGPGEGATSISLDLARSLQKNGDKVLLIDANLRLPGLGERVEKEGIGLAEVLTGEHSATDTIVRTPNEPDFLLAGGVPENPAEMLGSDSMRKLLAELRDRYEVIILDTPPAGMVADAMIIGGQTDAVILVVEDGVANKRQVRKTIDAIEKAGGNLVGAVMNKTELQDMR